MNQMSYKFEGLGKKKKITYIDILKLGVMSYERWA